VQAALGVVARMLHAQPRGFGFAGTKDKRGVTTQWVTAFKVAPAKLAALNPRCDTQMLLLCAPAAFSATACTPGCLHAPDGVES
jgi:tRNA pseudouridine13 synthase